MKNESNQQLNENACTKHTLLLKVKTYEDQLKWPLSKRDNAPNFEIKKKNGFGFFKKEFDQ